MTKEKIIELASKPGGYNITDTLNLFVSGFIPYKAVLYSIEEREDSIQYAIIMSADGRSTVDAYDALKRQLAGVLP